MLPFLFLKHFEAVFNFVGGMCGISNFNAQQEVLTQTDFCIFPASLCGNVCSD